MITLQVPLEQTKSHIYSELPLFLIQSCDKFNKNIFGIFLS